MEKKKIKIVYIIPALDAGGAERFILDLIHRLDHDLFAPALVLFSHGGFFVEEAQRLGIETIILKKRFKFDPINLFKLYKTVEKLRPDIVHTQLGGDIYGRFVAHKLKVPVIVSTEQNVQTGESAVIRNLKKWTARFAHRIVAISEAVKADTIKRYGVPKEKVEIIYNGLEINKFLIQSRRPATKRVIIGSVGRLTRQKNYRLLIEALAGLQDHDWECRIAGEGELRTDLERQITELGLNDRVKLVGLQKNVQKFLSDLDIFVLPSLWEGLGIVLLEAGLAGLPVLASRVDGICEIIKDGQNGILFNSNDQEDLMVKLRKMIENNSKPAMLALGTDLQSDIQANFDIRVIAQKYQDMYIKLLGQK